MNETKPSRLIWTIKKKEQPSFSGKKNPTALNILIIHKTNCRNDDYKEKLFKRYSFLKNKKLYTVTVKNIRKKPPMLDYAKIYIDDNVPDDKIFDIRRMFPNAIINRYSLEEGKKKKATVDMKITKLETKKFLDC